MNLVDESFKNKEEKKKKFSLKIILAAIILVVFIIIGIIAYLGYIKSQELKIYLNGEVNSNIEKLLLFEGDTIYVNIKDVAQYFDYESFNGEYSEKSEVNNKCYVQCANEVANFTLGSKKIYKLLLDDNDSNYEYVYSKNMVISRNGILYASTDGIEKAFNVSFDYDQERNRITIWTMQGLINYYKTKVNEWNYVLEEENFANQITVLDDMLVVKRSDNDKTYGVIDTEGQTVLDIKYESISYLPNTKDFLVGADGKVGIISGDKNNKKTKVKIMYDSISLMDSDANLYLVENDGKYGAIDLNGNIKIYIENDEIGIDISKFKENNIKSKYILADKFIPVKKNEQWGLYDISGKLIVDFNYDEFGYITKDDKTAYNLLVIPDYNVIVAQKNKKYTLINSSGKALFQPIADDIYMTINGGKKQYWIAVNDETIDAIEKYLKKLSVPTNNSSNQDGDIDNSNNDQEQSNDRNQQENDENQQEENNNEENNNEENNNQDNEE